MDNYNPMMQDMDLFLERKNKSYGDSIGKSGDILRILCPTGIPVDIYHRCHIIIRCIDKLARLLSPSIEKEAALDAWRDIVGYAMKASQIEEAYFDSTRKDD